MTALAHGPDAVGRHEGRVVFVPQTAPGDRVRVRIVEEHGNWARAVVVHRCAPGAAFREPPCPWFATCGGCSWQQVTYAAQRDAKERNVHESLRRIAGVVAATPLPILAAPDEWGYRHRIRLHVGPDRALGYQRPRSHEIVAIEHCLIAEPALSALLPAVRALVADLATSIEAVELATNGRGAVVLRASTRGRLRASDAAVVQAWLAANREAVATPPVAGVTIRDRARVRHFGDVRVAVVQSADLSPVVVARGGFTQVNRAANELLVRTVVAWTPPGRRLLDLHCGAGNLSLPLARVAASVVGVDADAGSIADAAANAAAAGLTNARFEASVADRFLRRRGLGGAEVVVLDPPRSGDAAVAAQLARLGPDRVLYVSCDPTTLARDARTLVEGGYRVERVQPIDLFPQTEHVETVLEAVLTAR